jgi:hypothetical protein
MVTQLAVSSVRTSSVPDAADRQTALDFGAQGFLDLDNDAGGHRRVDLVFRTTAATSRSGRSDSCWGMLVSVVGPVARRRSGR